MFVSILASSSVSSGICVSVSLKQRIKRFLCQCQPQAAYQAVFVSVSASSSVSSGICVSVSLKQRIKWYLYQYQPQAAFQAFFCQYQPQAAYQAVCVSVSASSSSHALCVMGFARCVHIVLLMCLQVVEWAAGLRMLPSWLRRISRLTEDAAVQGARIERLEAALRTAQQYIKGKARPHEQGLDYKQPHAQLVLLQLEMLQQSTVADGLRQQLDRQNARVAELQYALDHQKPAKESLLRALEEQCSHAAELQRALTQQEARVEELQGEVEQQRAHVAELQGDLSREQAMCEALAAALEQSEEAQANAKRDPSVPSSAADATTAAAPGTPTAAAAAEDPGPSQEVGAASGAHDTHPPKAVERGTGTRTGTATATPGMCTPGAALHGTQHAARQGHPHSGESPESGRLGVFGGPAGATAAAAAAAQDAGSTQPCSDAASASGNQLKRGAGTDSKSATERRSSDYNSGMGNMSTQGLAMRSSKDRHLRESEMLTSSYSFKEERPMGTEALGNGVVAEAAGGPHGAVQNGSHAPEQGMRDHVREMESVLAVAVAGRSAAESEAAALQQELAEARKLVGLSMAHSMHVASTPRQ
ncbi:hypothetical protein DUNSADRAFT_16632 [Dunaliella salina]|uniref:Spindle pole component 29 n=1 Tax=Dunaliella salina TaxID=3046 RepID=A0ABQ7G381_DUNSA|nr:hypothetical protein DUNSADRAFT_16632 [Dunaliella salina]|eukprot:KAF5829061.1 hypothetical protein DUNSADRAFT_16632 [Dunaliella salina]